MRWMDSHTPMSTHSTHHTPHRCTYVLPPQSAFYIPPPLFYLSPPLFYLPLSSIPPSNLHSTRTSLHPPPPHLIVCQLIRLLLYGQVVIAGGITELPGALMLQYLLLHTGISLAQCTQTSNSIRFVQRNIYPLHRTNVLFVISVSHALCHLSVMLFVICQSCSMSSVSHALCHLSVILFIICQSYSLSSVSHALCHLSVMLYVICQSCSLSSVSHALCHLSVMLFVICQSYSLSSVSHALCHLSVMLFVICQSCSMSSVSHALCHLSVMLFVICQSCSLSFVNHALCHLSVKLYHCQSYSLSHSK